MLNEFKEVSTISRERYDDFSLDIKKLLLERADISIENFLTNEEFENIDLNNNSIESYFKNRFEFENNLNKIMKIKNEISVKP